MNSYKDSPQEDEKMCYGKITYTRYNRYIKLNRIYFEGKIIVDLS